ncbi:hypothetical protein ACE38W_15570 [Chitinophaga sp. Hz27]|uniref:hypothetical protein n=1 Tax=Chitinophaga sp. Hz27 TaxID=3347169 RepID=UPI0035E06616
MSNYLNEILTLARAVFEFAGKILGRHTQTSPYWDEFIAFENTSDRIKSKMGFTASEEDLTALQVFKRANNFRRKDIKYLYKRGYLQVINGEVKINYNEQDIKRANRAEWLCLVVMYLWLTYALWLLLIHNATTEEPKVNCILTIIGTITISIFLRMFHIQQIRPARQSKWLKFKRKDQ